MASTVHCVTCGHSLARERQRHELNRDILDARPDFADYVLVHLRLQNALLNEEQWMCHRCWVAASRHVINPSRSQDDGRSEINSPATLPTRFPSVSLEGYTRAANTSNRCIFPSCEYGDLVRIPLFIKLRMLTEIKFYIPPSARVCNEHLNGSVWPDLSDVGLSTFTPEQIKDMLDTLVTALTQQLVFDFDKIEMLTAEELHFCIGLTLDQFHRVLEETPSIQEQSRRPKTVLGAYLMKIRSGEPNERLAARLGMSRRTLERKLALARHCLLTDFVPRHLGWNHISREEIISRNLLIPDALYGGNGTKAILIADGTYIYINKSSNFLFQKQSYSMHKFRNLLKPYLTVCTDGYIVDVTGPHAATTSDATIMSNEMHEEAAMHIVLHAGEVFILDRGFRDSISNIQTAGYEAHMPPTKSRYETQLSTEDANKSRMITIVRWVVEVINGRLKRDFKILRQDYFNRALPHMFDDVKIAAALTNTFKAPVNNTPHASDIIRIISERLHEPNRLGDYVVSSNLNRQRAAFRSITEHSIELTAFPQLSEEDLVLIALGTYQIKLARSYVSEHTRNGVYNIEICESVVPDLYESSIIHGTEGVLLRGRIQSRHISNKTYYSYIVINTQATGRESVRNYYCSCLTGRRTIGTCAHIMSIMWYLGWARHQQDILYPATFLDGIIVDNVYY